MLPSSSIEESRIGVKNVQDKAISLDFVNKKCGKVIDKKEALEQWIKIALMTQRYKYPVFSHSFGMDFEKAMEEGYIKAIGIIKNEITESLLCNDRIVEVKDFVFEKKGTSMIVNFKVVSDYGNMNFETEVE